MNQPLILQPLNSQICIRSSSSTLKKKNVIKKNYKGFRVKSESEKDDSYFLVDKY